MTAAEDLYIWMRNWERFQHYKDRTPDWIKAYTELMSSDDYLRLSLGRRGILHGLWLEFASSRRRLLLDTAIISRRLNGRVTMADIDSLNHAGFLEIVASGVLAEREQAYSRALASRAPARSREPEPEEEKEKEPDQTRTSTRDQTTSSASNGAGLDPQTELELVELMHWIGDHADDQTPAVLRHNWTQAPEAARLAVNQSRKTSRPRHRARWLIGTIKAETERARSTPVAT